MPRDRGGEEGQIIDESKEIIGRGTWLDRVAKKILDREKTLDRDMSIIRVESGLGASGIPHIGSLGDAARAYGVKMALEEARYRSKLIAYSDDMDALRRVPVGLPSWLERDIGRPVSEIRDPYACHPSYGAHMSSLLVDGLDRLGVSYVFQSGYEAYRKGLLTKQVDLILRNAKRIGEKNEELTGQTKYKEVLPYFPRCEKCGRLNVAQAIQYDSAEKKVSYRCAGDEIGKHWVEGCGHEGRADIAKGEGKLPWKFEFAARWAAFDIRYEAYGKELRDSVRINDWVAENVLAFSPPYHVVYELFQDKSGKKISKSVGNLVSPQKWLSLATPASLMLLYFKRIVGARSVSEEDIPSYMDEFDSVEDLYFGKTKEPNKMKEARLKGLYYYTTLRNPPDRAAPHVPYRLLIRLASIAPAQDPEEYIAKKLIEYAIAKQVEPELLKRIRYALNWAKEFQLGPEKVSLTRRQAEVITSLAKNIAAMEATDGENIQAVVFETARSNGMEPSELFRTLYTILLGTEKGPRLGNYIADIGPSKVASWLMKAAQEERAEPVC